MKLVQIRDLHFRSVTLVKTYTVLDVFFVFVQKHFFFHSLVNDAFVFEILYTLAKYALSLFCYLVLYIDI